MLYQECNKETTVSLLQILILMSTFCVEDLIQSPFICKHLQINYFTGYKLGYVITQIASWSYVTPTSCA